MHNIYLYQPQFSVEFHGQKNYWIPYSVGCLWSYLQQYKDITDNWDLKELGHKREDQQLIVDRMENPKLCGFSCYVWNERYSLDLAKKVKEKFPECVIAFGGQSKCVLLRIRFYRYSSLR